MVVKSTQNKKKSCLRPIKENTYTWIVNECNWIIYGITQKIHTHTHTHIYHHHHHIVLAARISLTLSRHSSLSFIALGRSSGQQPVSSHSCWMYVRTGRPAFARPCVGIHKSTSLMSSSLLLQQCPACLVRLTWIVFVIGGRWPYSWMSCGVLLPGLVQRLHAAKQRRINRKGHRNEVNESMDSYQ